MYQLTSVTETRQFLDQCRNEGKTVGFVPTMGALHDGHLNLIRMAKAANDICVASIFVNPTQFNNPGDLEKYPRNLLSDAKMLENEGCDLLFAPEVQEMYPNGQDELVDLDFGRLDKVMEGRFRPGHFRGVATVVHRLFDIIRSDQAFFGKKDYQQLAIIRAMVKQLKLTTRIVPCETVREPDGLAMSSRNLRLTIAERQVAPAIYQTLTSIKQKAGKESVEELKSWGTEQIENYPGFRVEYLEIANKSTLQPITTWRQRSSAVIFVAAFLGDVRLIDNLEIFS